MRKLPLIVGPTGIGKTELSHQIADRLKDVEIVCADSRQVYRYLNVGTAKPTQTQMSQVPHHFIDIVDPDCTYTAGVYGKEARRVIDDIFKRRKHPIVVGGSGLYIRALLDGIFEEGPIDPEVKRQLQKEIESKGPQDLHYELSRVDPASAQKIHPNDRQRIVRALLVFRSSGYPLSHLHETSPPHELGAEPLIFGITTERGKLYRNIEERVDKMIRDGLIDEVRLILEMGYSKELNSLQTVGYREVFPLLDGQATLQETTDAIKRNSRRYAKRQFTWFRGDSRTKWVEKRERESIIEELEACLGF